MNDADRDEAPSGFESHCGWMGMMMKPVANKVKLNGLLSGECCYRGGTIPFAWTGTDDTLLPVLHSIGLPWY